LARLTTTGGCTEKAPCCTVGTKLVKFATTLQYTRQSSKRCRPWTLDRLSGRGQPILSKDSLDGSIFLDRPWTVTLVLTVLVGLHAVKWVHLRKNCPFFTTMSTDSVLVGDRVQCRFPFLPGEAAVSFHLTTVVAVLEGAMACCVSVPADVLAASTDGDGCDEGASAATPPATAWVWLDSPSFQHASSHAHEALHISCLADLKSFGRWNAAACMWERRFTVRMYRGTPLPCLPLTLVVVHPGKPHSDVSLLPSFVCGQLPSAAVIRVLEDPSTSGLDGEGTLWPSAVVLSRFLATSPELRTQLASCTAVLELGAGLGLVSMTAAHFGEQRCLRR
jgi:hypothetical protein